MRAIDSSVRANINKRMMAGRAFSIKTPMCAKYLKQINNWLITGSHGGIVSGQPRLGKTSATRWVIKMLPNFIGNFPSIEIPVRAQPKPSERAFFQHILHCIKHRHANSGTAADKRDALLEWLVAKAKKSEINCAVMFLDEAQLLTDEHYWWLLNIGNELDINGCRLFCLLVGQAELEQTKARYIGSDKEQIVGRYMVRELEFTGIESQEDLILSLNEFHNTIYPVESNYRFASNFIPEAIEGGFDLSSLGPAMWAVFQKLSISEGLDDVIIPMHYFTATLMDILNTLVDSDNSALEVPHHIIADAVDTSGYRDSLQMRQFRKITSKKART